MAIISPSIRTRNHPGHDGPGDKQYDRPCGYRHNPAFILSYRVAERMAARMGMTLQQAHQFVIGFGQVTQELLFEGTPVGIPHFGVLFVAPSMCRLNGLALAASLDKRGRPVAAAKVRARHGTVVKVNRVRLSQSVVFKRVYLDNLMYTGTVNQHLVAERTRMKHLQHNLEFTPDTQVPTKRRIHQKGL